MLKKLFKPKWQNRKPSVRLDAVSKLETVSAEDEKILRKLALGDVDARVRLAAFHKLDDPDLLMQVVDKEIDDEAQQQMLPHLLNSLPINTVVDESLVAALNEIPDRDVETLLFSVKNLQIAELFLERVADEERLVHCALQLHSSALRQRAAERVEQESCLEAMEKGAKGHDKSVFRIARNKLSALRDARKESAQQDEHINQVCLNMEQLSRSEFEPAWESKVEHWHREWSRVEQYVDTDVVTRFSRAYELCRQRLAEQDNPDTEVDENAEDSVLRESIEERMGACEQLEAGLEQLQCRDALDPAELPSLSALLKTQSNRWNAAAEDSEPAQDERKRFNNVFKTLQKAHDALAALNERGSDIDAVSAEILSPDKLDLVRFDKLKKRLDKALKGVEWPNELAQPERLKMAEAASAHYLAQREALAAEQIAAQETFKKVLAELDDAVSNGHLKQANKLVVDAQKHIDVMVSGEQKDAQQKLRSYQAKVNELRDWQGYAITPKQEQLCDDMEALVGQDMDPQELANRIKRLQEQWKALGHNKDTQQLWKRFSAAADNAYEPCKAYFENLSQVREKNLEARKQLAKQLEEYLDNFDFATADWVLVNQVFQAAKQEWRQYTPVSRKEAKPTQDHFNQLLDRLHGKLAEQWDANKQTREALIAQAEALAEQDDNKAAIEGAKRLQREWKNSGVVARKDDQKLWARFRKACDVIFERRDAEREESDATRRNNATEANHLIELVEHLTEARDMSFEERGTQFQELQGRFSDLGQMPRDEMADIKSRFSSVCQTFEKSQLETEAAEHKAHAIKLWRDMREVDRFEQQCLNQESLTDEMRQRTFLDPLDSGINERYQRLITMADAADLPSQEARNANESELHQLCMELEIQGQQESPESDQRARMELQVDRLARGMRQRATRSESQQLMQLYQRWCDIGPVTPEKRREYTDRFIQILWQIGEL